LHTYQDSYKHKGLRQQLALLLKGKGIHDQAVLEAISMLPRHFFMPADFESHAYEDKAFPIGEGQTISQPYTVAYQTQLLGVRPGMKVLEIGTGSGYQSAVLLACGARVFSIERHRPLTETAMRNLKHTFPAKTLANIQLFVGDGSKGLSEHGPYDRVIVTAGAPSVPKTLLKQLSDGGILVIPVGKDEVQKMVRIIKVNEQDVKTEIFDDFSFVPLVGENAWKP
jgi:protein-L-isoaspartate(D-aspartate) O-methyltransferase